MELSDNKIKKKLRNLRIIRGIWILFFFFTFFFVMLFINMFLALIYFILYLGIDTWFGNKEQDFIWEIGDIKHHNNSLLKYMENDKRKT